MHLSVRLPKVLPDQMQPPTRCPLKHGAKQCPGKHFKLHQVVCRKPLRDTKFDKVICHRYRCLKCHSSFRVYQPITFEILEAEASLRIEQWLKGLARVLGAEILVTDDADGLKTVADHLGLQHQICRAHVNRNVHDLVAALGTKALEHPDPVPWELPALTLDQFLEDLDSVEWIIKSMPANGQVQLQELAARYQGAPPPSIGKRATMWYRMRLLTLDWSENWARLALYQHWRSEQGEKLDGTNNVTEQVIGQCVKERYRTMRGYKCKTSMRNVSGLIGWVRAKGPDYGMTELFNG